VKENKILQENMIKKGFSFVQKFNDAPIANNFINLYQALLNNTNQIPLNFD
jgi:hypothetical protein